MPLPVGKAKVKERTLTIKNLSPADSGYYVCVASNVMGTKKVRIDHKQRQTPVSEIFPEFQLL